MNTADYDVIIIGAGAVGCAVARELSRYELSIAVLEKNSDVAGETTGRNSAVVHAGFNNRPGSMMARLCVEGNEGFGELCRELDVPCRKTGKLLLAFDDADAQRLEQLLHQGRENGCRDLRILEREELGAFLREHGMENLIGLQCALWSPHTAVTNPFLYCVALAENALMNGAEFHLDSEVTGIRRLTEKTTDPAAAEFGETRDSCLSVADERRSEKKKSDEMRFEIRTEGRDEKGLQEKRFRCRFLINCAGLQADRIAAMAGAERYRIYPCRGEYFILDKYPLPMPVYPAPRAGAGGLGVHLTPTIEGNILIGPSAEYLEDDGNGARSDYECTRPVMEELMRQARQLMPSIAGMQPIGNYSGIRPKLSSPQQGGYQDFVIRAEEDVPGLIDLVGIESPGLTASVPIAREVCRLLDRMAANDENAGMPGGLRRKPDFIEERRGILRFRDQSPQKQEELIREDPDYGEIICRCQQITKKEIRQAIENPLGAQSLSAIKYRAWTTTGRCNGGYCLPRIAEMLVREYGISPDKVRYRNEDAWMFTGYVK